MGINIGFDLYPPIQKNSPDESRWSEFIENVKNVFKDDTNVQVTDKIIEFQVGEYPFLTIDGSCFRRFTSKITGRCGPAEPYIDIVLEIANRYFPGRLYPWNDCDCKTWGRFNNEKYDWSEVRSIQYSMFS